MRARYCFFLLLIITLLCNVVYAQVDENAQQRQTEHDTSDILSYTQDSAKSDASNFITLIGLSPLELLRKFANSNNIEYTNTDTDLILRQKIIKAFLDIEPTIITVSEGSESISRNITSNSGNIVLHHADIVEAYEIEETNEEVLFIYGNVNLKMNSYNINSDTVVYSNKTGEIFGTGDVRMTSPTIDMTGRWFLVNKDSNVGVLYSGTTLFQTFVIEGSILKFRDDVFIADDAKISFSKLNPPAHSLSTKRILVWDEKKIMIYNGIYSVGKQPVVGFPFFVQNNFGTGIITSLGQSTREGMYIQNSKKFKHGNLENTVRFDAYQKLGFLLGDELRYNTDDNSINFDAMIAAGRKYELLDGIPAMYYYGSYYGNYFLPDLSTEYDFRYRFDYSQSFLVHQNSFMKTTINGNLIFASDLYFKSDFYNKRDNTGLIDTITSLTSTSSDIGSQTAESYINNKLNIVNSGKNHNVSLNAAWNLSAIRNLSADNNVNFDYEKPMTTSIVLPAISASYNNTLGSYDDYYLHGLNINYSLSAKYSRTINYVPTEGLFFEDNPNLDDELNNILSEKNVMNFGGSLSRAFTNSFVRYTPSVTVAHNRQITENPTDEEEVYDNEYTYTSLANNHSLSFFLPSDLFDKDVYKYFQPNFSFNNNYNIAYKFKENYYDYDSFGGFSQNNFTSSLNIGGTLYGLFYLTNLNFYVLNTTQTGYDFRPNYNAYEKEYYFENSQDRILNTYNKTSFRLSYNNSYVSYDVNYNILETNLTGNAITTYLHLPIELKNAVKFIFSPLDKQNNIDKYLTKFDLYCGFTYRHDFETYLYNYMDFKFGVNLTINELWVLNLAISSRNNRAFRYVKSYAEEEGYPYVNFFEDIANSFSFSDYEKISGALFKLESIEASLWHDLDGWDMIMSFGISPKSLPSDLTSGSVKGYYWDKSFSVEFRLTEFSGISFPAIEPDLNTEIDTL